MTAKLERGAVNKLEVAIEEAAREELANQSMRVSATQHAPGIQGEGTESVIIELTANVEDDIVDATLDAAYEEFVGSHGNLIAQTIQHSHERLHKYGSVNNYSVDPIINSFTGVDARRNGDTITIGYSWSHPASSYMERGTSDHTINGQPVLSFIWEDPPDWVREEFEQARGEGGQFASGWRVFLASVEVSGLPKGRWVRAGLDWLRREVS